MCSFPTCEYGVDRIIFMSCKTNTFKWFHVRLILPYACAPLFTLCRIGLYYKSGLLPTHISVWFASVIVIMLFLVIVQLLEQYKLTAVFVMQTVHRHLNCIEQVTLIGICCICARECVQCTVQYLQYMLIQICLQLFCLDRFIENSRSIISRYFILIACVDSVMLFVTSVYGGQTVELQCYSYNLFHTYSVTKQVHVNEIVGLKCYHHNDVICR